MTTPMGGEQGLSFGQPTGVPQKSTVTLTQQARPRPAGPFLSRRKYVMNYDKVRYGWEILAHRTYLWQELFKGF
jgi:hypothetical protein